MGYVNPVRISLRRERLVPEKRQPTIAQEPRWRRGPMADDRFRSSLDGLGDAHSCEQGRQSRIETMLDLL